jgi:hypothetical protein
MFYKEKSGNPASDVTGENGKGKKERKFHHGKMCYRL